MCSFVERTGWLVVKGAKLIKSLSRNTLHQKSWLESIRSEENKSLI